MPNIFQDATKKIPMIDQQIVRVSMQESEIAGRKDNLPSQSPQSANMAIQHVANKG